MAIDKAKVLAAFQLKFKGKSLSKTFLDKLATRYAEKIATDADMDDYINDREDDIIAAGEEADRRVNAALKKPKDDGKGKADTKEEPVIDDDELKDAPPYVKAMMKQMQGMADQITGLKAEKTADTIQKRFLEDPRLKGISPKLLKGRIPKTEDEFEAAIEETAEDLKEFVSAEGADGSGKGRGSAGGDRPGFAGRKPEGAGAGGGGSTKVPEAIKQFTESFNKSANNSKN